MKPKLKVSSSVVSFKEKAEKTWKLEKYNFPQDIFKPVVFFGMYHWADYRNFVVHRGERSVFWCGHDVLNLTKQYFFSDGRGLHLSKRYSFVPWYKIFHIFKATHYVENELEQEELKSLGIESEIRPSFLEDINDFPVCFKPTDRPQVFLTAHPDREEEYGIGLVKRIAEKLHDITFHIYGIGWFGFKLKVSNIIWHGRVPPERFNKEIKNYHCGLRTNKHDGFSEIPAKSVLMGQYPITRIKYPMIDNYKTEEELIALLKELKNKTKPNLESREFWRKHVNNYPWTK